MDAIVFIRKPCIFSGYRCWNDNKFHGRSSTNHMGKALDIHFYKNGVRKDVLVTDMEEIRDNIYLKYLGAQLKWSSKNKFSLEPTRRSYPKEFIATTWIHFDVREFDSIYLEDRYFSKTIEELKGKNIIKLAQDLNLSNMCDCLSTGKVAENKAVVLDKNHKNNFTIKDAEIALKIINNKYGKTMAKNIEMIYRWECDHFRSGQYTNCGAPGMEVSNDAKGPEYGWNGDLYDKHPEFTPIGLWSKFENKGKSGLGGNNQVTDKPKKYIMFPSVEAGMTYVAEFILRYNGNVGRWHTLDIETQNNYIKDINSTIPRISNNF